MWLDNLKELKKQSGMSAKQIAEKTNLPERTVSRIFSGDTANPLMDTLRRIVDVLGGSLDDIFVESRVRVANTDLIALQAEYDKLQAEASDLRAENVSLKDKVVTLEVELDRLRLTLAHKEEMLAHKDEIVSLQKELIDLHRNSKPENNVWKL
jgi:transcriptional regulator with XRE-family HTH domain